MKIMDLMGHGYPPADCAKVGGFCGFSLEKAVGIHHEGHEEHEGEKLTKIGRELLPSPGG